MPMIAKCNTYNYLQYIVLDNDNKQLCYWFMHLLLYHTILVNHYFRAYFYFKTMCHVILSVASYTLWLPCLFTHQEAPWSDCLCHPGWRKQPLWCSHNSKSVSHYTSQKVFSVLSNTWLYIILTLFLWRVLFSPESSPVNMDHKNMMLSAAISSATLTVQLHGDE
jgi:hypothetical protein